MRSKFFSNTVDTGARGEEESGVVDYDAVRLAERESQKEAESRAVDVKLGQLAYKVGSYSRNLVVLPSCTLPEADAIFGCLFLDVQGAGTEGVRRVGGDGFRRSATRVGGPSSFVDRMGGGGGGAVGGRVTLRGGAR